MDEKQYKEILLDVITERNKIVYSKFWRYTTPLRMIATFIRKHKLLRLLFKSLSFIIDKIINLLYILYKNRNNKGFTRRDYINWIKINEPSYNDLELQKQHNFSYRPKISIVIPMYNSSFIYLKELITSIQKQTYDNWELCLADGSPEKNKRIEVICDADKRIRYLSLGKDNGISGNTNEAIKFANGEYIAFMYCDDTLAPFALYENVECINNHLDIEFIYSDEDYLINGKRRNPYFKPDFAPDTLRSFNFIKQFVVMKRSLAERLGNLNGEYDGMQDYDYILRASEATSKIHHIRKILYHQRCLNKSVLLSDAVLEIGKKILEDHMKRIGFKGKVKREGAIYYPIYDVIGNPSVSIVIPNKDHITTLKICIDSILLRSTYTNYKIVIVENNSENEETFIYYRELEKHTKIRVIYYPEKGFNYSKLINFGVKNCTSDYIVQLNNDTEIITPNWLELMLGLAQRPDVGAVGVKLLYPDGSIQHAGVYLHSSGWFYLIKNKICGIQNYIALVGACVMSRKEAYEKIGYMDEEFQVSHGDVDFCLALREIGLYTVFTPLVELKHYEGKTRGYDNTPEKISLQYFEWILLSKKWQNFIKAGDPYIKNELSKKSFIQR
jgi:GT2 family glycosyltransferase